MIVVFENRIVNLDKTVAFRLQFLHVIAYHIRGLFKAKPIL